MNSRKKIAIVLYYYVPYISGLTELTRGVAETLASSDEYEVTVYCAKHDKRLATSEIIRNVNVKRFNTYFSVNRWVFSPGLLVNVIKNQKKYDKIIFLLPFAESFVFSFTIPKKKLITYYVCDINLNSGILGRIINNVIFISMKSLLRKSSKIFALSKDYFIHSKIYNKKFEKKLFPLNPPLLVSEFRNKGNLNSFKKKFHIPENKFIIGFLGRLVFEKGINYLVDAIELLKNKGINNLHLIIAGDYKNIRGDSVYDQLKEKINKLAENITVTGFLSDEEKDSFFKTIDVFVLPSIDPLEAFGMVQVEAMVYGVPVIASNMPGVREIIKNTKFGKLVEIKNSQEIADKIIEIKNNYQEIFEYKDEYKKFYDKTEWEKTLFKNIN